MSLTSKQKSRGLRGHPWRTPVLHGNVFEIPPFAETKDVALLYIQCMIVETFDLIQFLPKIFM